MRLFKSSATSCSKVDYFTGIRPLSLVSFGLILMAMAASYLRTMVRLGFVANPVNLSHGRDSRPASFMFMCLPEPSTLEKGEVERSGLLGILI
jgi:hypothetical protein